jgi:murein DD-endopeptidase MepM/ murein hydrolase activator NlpD
MGARLSRLLSLGLIVLGASVAPTYPADADRPSLRTDLGARILAGPALDGRQLVGQPSALVSAAQGRAFVLEMLDGQPTARAVKTSTPVYKAFGLNASGERLLYRPLLGDAPSGELAVEDLATGATRRISSHYALEAAWSPRDRDLLAFTFASGQGYGLALVNVRTRRLKVVWSEEVLPDYLAWEADGSGVYYYRAVEKERTGVGADSGFVVVEHSYTVLTPSFHPLRARTGTSRASEEVAPSVLPAGFPVLDKPAAEELSEPVIEETSPGAPVRERALRSPELPADLHAFRVLSPAGDREVQGQNLLADGALSVRELPDGTPRLLGRGRLVKVAEGGVLLRTANPFGSSLEFVAWDGQAASVATTAAVSYGIPFPRAYITQGGQSFPSPNCTSYYTHKSTNTMGFANDMWNSAGHILASAAGTVVYVRTDVTCNTCSPGTCADYRSSCVSNSGWGNVVILEHADGTWTKYTHMRPGSARVGLGESVCAGLWIGTQGHTGCTAGNPCGDHLHFQRQSSSALSGYSQRIDFFDATNPLACYNSYTSGLAEASACSIGCINTAVPAADWKGEYFAGTQLAGSALMVRDEGTGSLAFDWGAGGPGCEVPADGFSARFTRTVSFAAGTQRFTARSDNGVRVWVDGTLLLDKWLDQAPTTYTFDVALTAGSHTVKAEYYESTGSALLQLSWQPVQGVAQFICDDGDACLTLAGPSAYWHRATTCGTSALGYGGDMYWTYVNGSTVSNSARWTPALGGPGTYQLSVFVPRCKGTSQQARYRIVHNGVTDLRTVNQNAYYDVWVPLGSFSFAGTGGEYVELTDATGESYSTLRQLAVDAIRWVRQ